MSLSDYLAQLRRTADGALATLSERRDGATAGESFWDGYRQAVTDMTEFVNTHEREDA